MTSEQSKKIFILLGHPDNETYTGVLTDTYEKSASEAGHEIRRMNLGDLSFDPILRKGYKEIQELEPELKQIQENFLWANHIMIAYPNWWNTMPALLKGMFDRMWLPGFAFNFDENGDHIKHLSDKSARVIVTSGSYSPFMAWFKFGDFTNEIERSILEFSGMDPVDVSVFGPCTDVDGDRREEWKQEVAEFGKRGE